MDETLHRRTCKWRKKTLHRMTLIPWSRVLQSSYSSTKPVISSCYMETGSFLIVLKHPTLVAIQSKMNQVHTLPTSLFVSDVNLSLLYQNVSANTFHFYLIIKHISINIFVFVICFVQTGLSLSRTKCCKKFFELRFVNIHS